MLFKIVKTYENNKDKLFAVPSFWEDKNILKWPRKNEAKHVKNESTPEVDWKLLRCVVKRRNIPSYETAEYVLKEMLNHTDTEDDTNTSKKPISEKPLRELNLNILADEIVYPAASGSNNVLVEMPTASGSNNIIVEMPTASESNNIIVEMPTASESNNIIVEMPAASGSNIITSEMPAAPSVGMDNVYEYHILQDNQSTTNQHQCYTNIGQNLEIQNVILSNQTQILNELKSIKNVQNIIIQKVSLFSIQLDDAVSQITQATDSNFQVTDLNESRSTPNNTAFYVKPVDNIQQLHELEQQLSESSVRQKMKNTYSVLCNGGKGIDCAYTLADILFSRDFLCQCTWSGGSRGSDTKIAWKSFKHILSFFWEMVHSWDKTYTINENESFFKNILKNSKKRKMAKNQRASTSRKRSKLSKAENANDYETSDEDMSNESNDDTINKENPVTEKKKQEKDQKAEKESDIVEENPITENNPEEKYQEAEKERDIDEVNKVYSNNSYNDEERDMNEENVKTDKNIEYEHKGNENCVIESKNSFEPNETNKEVDNIEKTTIDSKENEEDDAASKEIEREQNDDKKMTIDTMEVTNSEKNKENTLKERINKDKSNEPSTSSNSNFKIEKNIPKKKIVRISKKKREKNRLLKIKKNRPISHKNVSD